MKSNDIEKSINLYLDGQLSPAQREELKNLIETDPDVRTLFEQLQQADAMIMNAAGAFDETCDGSFETIYSQARDSLTTQYAPIRLSGVLRFGTGIAAGLLIAAGMFCLYTKSSPTAPPEPTRIAKDDQHEDLTPKEVRQALPYQKEVTPLVHDVDLYYYKDAEGNEWLIEGIRHEMVKQASAGSSL